MGIDVFISYSRQDYSRVQKLARELAPLGVIWWDEELIGGTRFWPEIHDKIIRAAICIVMVSKDSITSEWVAKEIAAALESQRTIVPIRLDSSPLPASIKQIDAIDLRHWDGDPADTSLSQLTRDIRLHLEAQRPPVRITEHASLELHTATVDAQNFFEHLRGFLQTSVGGLALTIFCMLFLAGAFYWLPTQRTEFVAHGVSGTVSFQDYVSVFFASLFAAIGLHGLLSSCGSYIWWVARLAFCLGSKSKPSRNQSSRTKPRKSLARLFGWNSLFTQDAPGDDPPEDPWRAVTHELSILLLIPAMFVAWRLFPADFESGYAKLSEAMALSDGVLHIATYAVGFAGLTGIIALIVFICTAICVSLALFVIRRSQAIVAVGAIAMVVVGLSLILGPIIERRSEAERTQRAQASEDATAVALNSAHSPCALADKIMERRDGAYPLGQRFVVNDVLSAAKLRELRSRLEAEASYSGHSAGTPCSGNIADPLRAAWTYCSRAKFEDRLFYPDVLRVGPVLLRPSDRGKSAPATDPGQNDRPEIATEVQCTPEDSAANGTVVAGRLPLLIEAREDTRTATRIRQALANGDREAIKRLIVPKRDTQAEALNIIGVINALSADPAQRRQGYLDVSLAAQRGSLSAKANQGLFLMLGVGSYIDPDRGAKLLKEAVASGLDLDTATWIWPSALSGFNLGSFSEAFQSLGLLAASGDPAAAALLGTFAARGIARPPCDPRCREVATQFATKLEAQGQSRWAFVVRAQLGELNAADVTASGAGGMYASYLSARKDLSVASAQALAQAGVTPGNFDNATIGYPLDSGNGAGSEGGSSFSPSSSGGSTPCRRC